MQISLLENLLQCCHLNEPLDHQVSYQEANFLKIIQGIGSVICSFYNWNFFDSSILELITSLNSNFLSKQPVVSNEVFIKGRKDKSTLFFCNWCNYTYINYWEWAVFFFKYWTLHLGFFEAFWVCWLKFLN